jgi:hypothetical protein
LGGSFAAIARNSFAISVKLGLSDGSDDQHLPITDLQSGSQDSGIGGRNVLLTIPPEIIEVQIVSSSYFETTRSENNKF